MSISVHAITALLQSAGREIVLPRFRALEQSEIISKPTAGDPADIVTVVDHQVEEHLVPLLERTLPGSMVVGEEGAYRDPVRLRALDRAAPVWLLDPIDGTKNFSRGDPRFAIMLALVVDGVTQLGWIHFPALSRTCVAERGRGVTCNEVSLAATPPEPETSLRGTLHTRFMSDSMRASVLHTVGARYAPAEDLVCAAAEYVEVLEGVRDFAVYYRLHPWDHAAPALVLTEGGGDVSHADGTPYGPRSADQLTVVGRDRETTSTVIEWITGRGGSRDGESGRLKPAPTT